MTTLEDYLKAADSTKLTEPQLKIVNQIKRGYRLKLINTQRMNGGEMVWFKDGIEHYAGHIYKAYQHLNYRLRPILGDDAWHVEGLWV